MKLGLSFSLLFHAIILGLSMVAFTEARRFDVEPVVAIAIETIPVTDFQELTQGDEQAKEVVEETAPVQAETPTTQTENTPNSQIDAPKTAPEIAEKVDDIKQVIESLPEEPAPQPEPQVTQAPPEPEQPAIQPEEPQEPELTQEQQILQQFAGLSVPKRAPKRPEPPKEKTAEQKAVKEDSLVNRDDQTAAPKATGTQGDTVKKTAGSTTGKAVTLSSSDKNNFRAQVEKCYRAPAFLQDKELKVVISIDLNPDGTLKQRPKAAQNIAHPEFATLSGAAIRALERCQPYTLRAGTFEAWKEGIDMRFGVDATL